jgi:hypothetical protein
MPLNALGLPFSYAVSSIFANRLLIAVRSAYYSSIPGSECGTDHPTIQFKANTTVISGTSTNDSSHLEESEGPEEKIGAWIDIV